MRQAAVWFALYWCVFSTPQPRMMNFATGASTRIQREPCHALWGRVRSTDLTRLSPAHIHEDADRKFYVGSTTCLMLNIFVWLRTCEMSLSCEWRSSSCSRSSSSANRRACSSSFADSVLANVLSSFRAALFSWVLETIQHNIPQHKIVSNKH